MTMRVLFNGTSLVRPGGATKVDASAFQNAGVNGVGIVGLIGEADGGQPGVAQIFTSPDIVKSVMRDGDLVTAAALAFNPMRDPRVPGGASQVVIVKTNQGTQASLSLKTGATTLLTLTTEDYGAHTNHVTGTLASSGGGQVLTIKFVDGTKITTETSPVLGATAEMSIRYVGAGSACTLTMDGTSFRTSVTGGPGGENLTILPNEFDSVADLVAYVDNLPAYQATLITSSGYSLKWSDFDYVSAIDIRSATTSLYAKLYRIMEWVNVNSALATAALPGTVTTKTAPDNLSETAFAGGTRGVSTNTDFQNALDTLKKLRVNQVAPLISYDLSLDGKGSTATFASVAAATDAHVGYMTSTAGKSERHAYIGMKGTKSAVVAQANTLNSFNTCLLAQKPTVLNAKNVLATLPEWALAVIAAGARAGSDLGEPLTWKYLNVYGLTQDASWDPIVDGAEMILNGVMIAEQVPTRGYRWVKAVTTYIREDNDAYTEESVVQGWKVVAYEFRTYLEDLFIGRKMSLQNTTAVKAAAEAKLSAFRDAGQIVDSLQGGVQVKAYRKLSVTGTRDQMVVSVEISPVEGINFMLNNLFLVPATFAV